jgi:hypothetical protein
MTGSPHTDEGYCVEDEVRWFPPQGFLGRRQWLLAYDVGLAVFLKHLIDVAIPHCSSPDDAWLADAISHRRRVAVIPDIGLDIEYRPKKIVFEE